MKVGKTGLAIKGFFIILLGLLVNYLTGYAIAYLQYITFYKIRGIEIIIDDFIKEPGKAFEVLILGNDTKEVYVAIHDIYTNPMFQIIFFCLYGYFIFSYFTKSKKLEKRDATEYGSHGTARWANEKEIKELTKTNVGFILGEHKKKLIVHPGPFTDLTKLNQNIASFGGAGTGKTAGYGIPNILNNADVLGESMIISDPKGELYNKTVPYLKEKGYSILYFNLLDMSRSLRYNPLDYVTNTEEALSLANMIISNTEGKSTSGDSMWKNAEMAYFAALMMYLKETMPKELQTIKSVLQLGTRIGADEEVLDHMFSGLPDDSEALEMYNIFRLAQDKTRAGILIGFGVRLKLWVSKNVANLTKTSDFDLNQLGEKKTALFLMIPDSDTTFDLLPALLLDQTFNVLYKQAGKNDTERLKFDVRCFLDELANIAAINGLERKVSTMRSRGISVVPIFQSITQFKNRYDQDRWSEILASSDTIVFLGTADKMTAKYFSEKLGNGTWLINSLSESSNNRGDSESKSYNAIARPLMTSDEIERLAEDEVIVFQRGKYPMKLKKHFYFKQPKWKDIGKVNWYEDIEPRVDGKIPLIDPFAVRETASSIEPEKEIPIEEQNNVIVQIEEKAGYISELMSEEVQIEEPMNYNNLNESIEETKDEAIPEEDHSFSDIPVDVPVNYEEELVPINDDEDDYLSQLMDDSEDEYK